MSCWLLRRPFARHGLERGRGWAKARCGRARSRRFWRRRAAQQRWHGGVGCLVRPDSRGRRRKVHGARMHAAAPAAPRVPSPAAPGVAHGCCPTLFTWMRRRHRPGSGGVHARLRPRGAPGSGAAADAGSTEAPAAADAGTQRLRPHSRERQSHSDARKPQPTAEARVTEH